LNDDVGGEPGFLKDSMQADLIQNIQAHIHANVDTLTNYLAKAQGELEETLTDAPRQAIAAILREQVASLEP